MSFAASQTKGSWLLWFNKDSTETIVLVKHITKIHTYSELDGTTILEIYTIGMKKCPTKLKIARTEKKALIDFLISEQNLVKPKSVTGSILAAACLI